MSWGPILGKLDFIPSQGHSSLRGDIEEAGVGGGLGGPYLAPESLWLCKAAFSGMTDHTAVVGVAVQDIPRSL